MTTVPTASSADSWRSHVLSHVGGAGTFKNIGKDAGIAAVFAIGGWLTGEDGPLKDANPNTKRLVNLAFGAPMLAKLELPELQKTWKEKEIPDFVMHGLTTAIATLGISTNDRDMINSAAMLATLFSMAGHLEEGVQSKSAEGIKSLEKLAPTMAEMHTTGKRVPVESVNVDDLLRVPHGQTVPVDSVVHEITVKGKSEGMGAVRLPQVIDGEGKQMRIRLGEAVPQGAIAAEGTHLVVKAKALAEDSAISRNITYLNEAETTSHMGGSVTKNIKNIYVPIMLAACAGEFAWSYYKHKKKHELDELAEHHDEHHTHKEVRFERWLGEKLGLCKVKPEEHAKEDEKKDDKKEEMDGNKPENRKRSEMDHMRKSVKRTAELAIKMAPCAIVASLLVIPFVKNALASRHRILVRDDAALENIKNVTHVLSDIRGTLTTGTSAFKGLHLWDEAAGAFKACEKKVHNELLHFIGKAETASEHQVATTLCTAAHEAGHSLTVAVDKGEKVLSNIEKKGVAGEFLGGHKMVVGAREMLEAQGHVLPEKLLKAAEGFGDVTYFAHDHGGTVRIGLAHFEDALRPGVRDTIQKLRKEGKTVVLVTGMEERAARSIMAKIETGDVPENPILLRSNLASMGRMGKRGKDNIVDEFAGQGVIAAFGDGHNDAAFMKRVKEKGGIALAISSTGAASTKDAASMVVEGIHQLPDLMKLSQNLNHALWLNMGAAASWMTLLVGSHLAGVHMKTQTASILHEAPTFLLTLASLGQSLKLAKSMPTAR